MSGKALATAFVLAAGLAALGPGSASPATSAAPTRTLGVTVIGKGTVTSAPRGIRCPRTCLARFRSGTLAKLTAKPAAGWRFARWKGACTHTKPLCSIRLRTAKKVTATFAQAPPPSPPPPPAPSGFTPQFIAGTWQGTWQNQTFGSSGPASFVVQLPDPNSFTFTATLGGNVFGCTSPPPTSGQITFGTGPNHWNADGFSVQMAAAGGGSVSIAYDFKANMLTGNGTSGCNPGITWTIKGSFNGNTFSGTVTITLPGGITATSVLNLTRS